MLQSRYQSLIIQGRKDYLKLSLSQELQLLDIYEDASKEITSKLLRSNAGTLRERYLTELEKSINNYKDHLRLKLENTIQQNMIGAAETASGTQISLFDSMDINLTVKSTFRNMFSQVPEDVVRLLMSGQYYSDGLTLSDRIWNLTNKNGSDIDKIINQAVLGKKAPGELAKDLEAYINPKRKMTTQTRVPGINKNIAYQAQRLARTSICHAFNESAVKGAMENPFATGVKWNLSSNHQARLQKFGMNRDICDDWAEANSYGLGSGIYPPDDVPIDHPNGLCFVTVEYEELDKVADDLNKWMKGQANPALDLWYNKYVNHSDNEIAATKIDRNDFYTKRRIPLKDG